MLSFLQTVPTVAFVLLNLVELVQNAAIPEPKLYIGVGDLYEAVMG